MTARTPAPRCGGSFELLETADRHFGVIVREFIDTVHRHHGLDPRLRELCAIGTVAAIDEPAELEVHLRRGLTLGVARPELLESVLVAFLFAGYPRLARALEVFRRVCGVEPGGGEDPAAYGEGEPIDGYNGPGLRIGIEMYGPRRARQNINNFRAWDPDFAVAVERLAYAGINRRRVLRPLDREICSVAILAALGKPVQLEWHAKAALRLGATHRQLRWAAIAQIAHVGFPPIIQAMRSLDVVLNDWLAHPESDEKP
jgi:alkylhydroperoxidase/carboxymuconolactone decarboxylase family protein YurZ